MEALQALQQHKHCCSIRYYRCITSVLSSRAHTPPTHCELCLICVSNAACARFSTTLTSCSAACAVSGPEKASSGAAKGGAGEEEFYPVEDEEVSPEDERALAAFMAPGASSFKQTSLGDLVLAKIREKQDEAGLERLPE